MIHLYHGYGSAIKTTNYWYSQQSGWITRVMLNDKANPKGYKLCDSIYVTFLKWKNYRNEEKVRGCQWLKKGSGQERNRFGYKRTIWGIFVMEMDSILTFNVHILVVRGLTVQGKVGKRYRKCLCIISYKYIWKHNDLKIENSFKTIFELYYYIITNCIIIINYIILHLSK